MTERKLIYADQTNLTNLFRQNYPAIVSMAIGNEDISLFKTRLSDMILDHIEQMTLDDRRRSIAEHFLRLIRYDGRHIYELSSSTTISSEPITLLWKELRCPSTEKGATRQDLFIDLLYQLDGIFGGAPPCAENTKMMLRAKRWHTGLDRQVIEIRLKNKDRIIRKLIQKIEHINSSTSRYQFDLDDSYQQKYNRVEAWWESSQFHLAMAIKSPTSLNHFLDDTLSDETMKILLQARKKGIPFFITPYYLSLLDTENTIDDSVIRTYVLYSKELVESYGSIKAWEKEDQIEADKPNAAGWLLPEGHNIHRRYPEVAILIPDSMGRACGGLCASCQRMYDFQSKRFNFDLEALKPKEGWSKKLDRLMRYFEEDTQLRDILITGGDALMSQNATLKNILNAVYSMAKRKRCANKQRADQEKYAELQRVRIGTRLLAYLPMRVTDELIAILSDFREKAQQVGITQFVIQTHFQSPLEVTTEAQNAIRKILEAGWIITNQSVYTVAASRRGHVAQLRKILNELGIICYYNFTVKGFFENYNMFTPNARSLQEMNEEKIFGRLNKGQEDELNALLNQPNWSANSLKKFLKKHHIPFVSTDRNTLNLPGVGKSMTFKTVGILSDGRRLLRFQHDHTRRHSPKVEQMDQVYIAENKSIAAYLRQLDQIGERIQDYHSIWYYNEGTTESRFSFFEYPDFSFTPVKQMNHIL